MQCVMTAMTTGAVATGGRCWLAQKRPERLTPRKLRYVTKGLLAAAVLVSATLSGSS
jgi:hypothetical protein